MVIKILIALLLFAAPCFAGTAQIRNVVGMAIQNSGGSIVDDFSSACTTTGCTNYTAITSYGMVVSSGTAKGNTNFQTAIVYHETPTGSDDHYVQYSRDNAYGGGVLRCNGTTGYLIKASNATTVYLYPFNGSTVGAYVGGGAWTGLTLTSSSVIKLTVTGNTFELFIDDVSQGTKSDATYSTGQYVGMHWTRGSGDNPAIDNFSGGAL